MQVNQEAGLPVFLTAAGIMCRNSKYEHGKYKRCVWTTMGVLYKSSGSVNRQRQRLGVTAVQLYNYSDDVILSSLHLKTF